MPYEKGGVLYTDGVFSDIMAMSGLSLLEVGIGLSLLSERIRSGGKRAPLFVLKLLAKAARQGRAEVALADDVYIVRKPPAEAPAAVPALKPAVAKPSKPATILLTPPIGRAPVLRADLTDEFAVAIIGLDDTDDRDWPYFTPPDSS